MSRFEDSIHDRSSATKFIEWCVREIGPGFHPDTPFSDYVLIGTNERAFDGDEVAHLNDLLDRAFEFVDPYEIGLSEQQNALGTEPGPGTAST